MPHFYGAVGAPKVGHHEWQPHSRRPLVLGNGRGKHLARLMLNEIRWRKPPRESGLRITAMVLAILVHVLALVLMTLLRPAGVPMQVGSPDTSTIDVRLIDEPKPPPPPPIKMPTLKPAPKKTVRVVRRVAPAVKQAPVAAMPPIPKPTLAKPRQTVSQPQVKLTPPKPHIDVAAAKPVPAQKAVSPPASEMPEIAMSPPHKVVQELSSQALAPPRLPGVEVTPVTVPSPGLAPIPTRHVAPQVALGKPDLDVAVQAAPPVQTVAATPVVAAAPALPSVTMTPTAVATPSVATPNVQAPTVKLTLQTPQAVQTVTASLAPIPRMATATSPQLHLPVADVAVAQAPHVEVAPVKVEVQVVATPAPAQTASVAQTKPAPARQATKTKPHTTKPNKAAKSWLPADDQFKPLSGHARPHGSQAHAAGSQPEGSVELMPRGNSNVMTRRTDHLGYKPTIFDQYWAPANENIFDSFLRHVIEKLTVEHTFELAPGIRVKCVLGPMTVFFACGSGSPPRGKSAKSDDPRLNMAPARPLVPGLGVPAPAKSAAAPTLKLDNQARCTVAEVAGSPLPPGCPGAPPPPSKSDVWH